MAYETPNIGLQVPANNQANWQVPTNFNWNLVDLIFGGGFTVPALDVGVLTAGTITGIVSTGVVNVAFATMPVFNAALGMQFKITLTGNVASSTFINGTAGPSIVAMRIVQDGIGGRTFIPPANMRNFGVINLAANSRSLQMFAVDTDGSADACGPMMYS